MTAIKHPKPTTEDKVVLLLALIPYLIANGATPIVVLAESFNVSANTIRNLATFLGMAGIPGETLTYQDQDLFDINWTALEEEDVLELVHTIAVDDTPRFSGAETAALMAGLHLLHDLLPAEMKTSITQLQKKLSGATTSLNLSLTYETNPRPPEYLADFMDAISKGQQVSFEYLSRQKQHTTRTVDPKALKQIGDHWYMQGFCYLRKTDRIFRLEDISSLTIVNRHMSDSEDHDLATHESRGASSLNFIVSGDLEVLARISATALHLIEAWSPEIVETNLSEEVIVKVSLAHEANAINLITAAPGHIEILSPLDTRNLVATWLNDTLTLFR
ncbi:MAG TPA: WYL domain-containing protein [Microbacteriaceae bacterium]|nr:WYL domain-containing protein [Microbacteriaceae bacterium]